MVSHDLFLSSPKRVQQRHETQRIGSSSPDLPPLTDILSQRYRKPGLKTGSRSAPIPLDAETGFQSASSLYSTINSKASPEKAAHPLTADSEVPLVLRSPSQALSRHNSQPATKPDLEEVFVSKVGKHDITEAPTSPSGKAEPWKKYKGKKKGGSKSVDRLKQDETEANGGIDTGPPSKVDTTLDGDTNIGETSRHFAKPSSTLKPANAKDKLEEHVPLDLEPAMARRADWTPPKPSAASRLEFDTALDQQGTSPDETGTDNGFANLLADYKFAEADTKDQPEVISLTDEDASFLRKRKRIDFVDTSKRAGISRAPSKEKSPTKQKAPKKKTRTITDLATEAYKNADPVGPTSAQESLLESFLDSAEPEATAADTAAKKKGKGKSKRAPRPSKKKAAPPPPVLLSPTAALRQAAQQDILFGTSSQLAHEKSPTFLRDLQKAMRLSMDMKSDPFETPLNSDGIEAPQQPQLKLWEAASRDEDGLLFDVEMVDLANGSLPLPMSNRDADDDPFGYKQPDLVSSTERHKAQVPDSADDSIIELPHMPATTTALSHGKVAVTQNHGRDSEPPQVVSLVESFSDSDISVSSNLRESHSRENKPVQQAVQDNVAPPLISRTEPSTVITGHSSAPQRPSFETYTDARLSSELHKFGFKPVKRRTAMITLLEQCWKSQHAAPGGALGQVASLSTSAATARPRTASPARGNKKTAPAPPKASQKNDSPGKRPRGRPRKNSEVEVDSQEPPPSAQPPETPKRGRGRPRKDESPSKPQPATKALKTAAERPGQKKKTEKEKATGKTKLTPKSKKTGSNVIEIPDSASDSGSDTTLSRSESPEPTFSSPEAGVDISLSMAEDSELSLSVSPDDEQEALFSSITKAVKSAPRTTDPQHPSWYEKMLMYDPIVIEDLAAWLNSGQLTKVGYDAEVRPGLVKKWCESKSVCCLWKVNLRGQERKRY